ncbi:TIGR02217 family protein [soil metagenome]
MLAAFSESRLPVRLGFGSSGGVERRTEVTSLASGYETRISPWANGRRRYLIGQGVKSLDDAAALIAFFEARRGRLQGFRFRDFSDFKSCAPSLEPQATDQGLGVGDGARTSFPLAKTYGGGDDAYVRLIAKPLASSVRVAVEGVELSAGAFSVDGSTGVVTLVAAPPVGAPVTAGFLFDTPVRFDADRIDVALEGFDAGRVAAGPLIEVRV